MSVSYTYAPKKSITGSTMPPQVGGKITFDGIVKGIEKGVDWAKKNKIVSKIDDFAEKVVPPEVKSSPYYQGFKKVTAAAKDLGFGVTQTGGVLIIHPKKRTRKHKK